MKRDKARRIAKRITAFAAAVAMAATFTFPAELGEGIFDGFGNAIVASAAAIQHNVADGDVNITAEGDYEITGTSSTSKIIVDCSGTVHIKLDTVTITASYNGNVLDIRNGIVNLELDGNSILQARQDIKKSDDKNAVYMSDSAELHIYDADNNGSIKIRGTSHYYGGGAAVRGGSMYIHSGNVSLIGGSMIMGGYGNSFIGKNFDVSGGSVSIAGGELDATKNGSITVSDSFKVGSGVSLTVPTNGTIEIGTGASAIVDGTIINNGTITNNGTLTNNGSIINFGSGSVTGTVSGNQPDTQGTAFTITGSGLVYGTDYTYPASTGVLTIKSDKAITIANANTGSTTDRIEVADGISANITLAGVNIDVSANNDSPAFRIWGNNYGVSTGNVIITIADNTTNILKSGLHWAGLTKPNGNNDTPRSGGWLKIRGGTNGTGILEAVGGTYGAGIGGSNGFHSCDIYIEGGNVSATGGNYGAGIGGGANREGNNITISGGTVSATGRSGGADVGGGGFGGSGSDITISGGSVKAPSISCTPTSNGTTNVYLLTIKNPNSEAVTIDGNSYIPVNHKALDNNDGNLYAYLPAKTSINDPLVVKVGTKTTKYFYDTANSKWIKVVDKPAADTTTFTYDGTEQTYTIAESTYYTVTGNKQTNAGTYDVTVALKDTDKTVWSDGTTADLTYTFKINKKPATVTPPTAPTAISYGEALAETGLTAGWIWEKGSNYMPNVIDNTLSAYMLVDDDNNYDYSNISGISYSSTEHKLSCDVSITVNPATPTITVTASPSSAITGKATTVTLTAEVKNPNNDSLNDLPSPDFSYKIGNGPEQAITNGSFVIPADTPNGTTFTISARTSETANYRAGTGTTTILVSDCTHPDVPAAWENDETYHWHECPDCGAELDKAEHSSNAAATETTAEVCKDCGYEMSPATGHIHKNHLTFVDKAEPADCTTDGTEAHYKCDCGKFFADDQAATEVTLESLKIAAHHSYGTEWVSDNDDNHYHVCSVCGDKTDITEHSYDNGVITTPATEQTTGIKTYTCSVCNHQKTEVVPKLVHTHIPSDEYSKDETGHWHACSGCDEKLDFAAHTYGKWKITVPSTAQANGKKERSCTICGYVQEGVVTYGGDESTGDMDNATKPENNACHADLELTDEEIINKIPLTPEELEAIENGADLEVYMVVIDYLGNVPSADKDLAEAVLTDGMKIGMYIDVTLFVKVGDNDPRAVTNTNGDLKITFEMPEKLINTNKNVIREYSIIRVHNGEAAILDCAYDKTTAKGSFVTDKFSTYSIAYKDITEGKPAPEPAPVVRYPIVINGNVTVDKATAAAGETVNVRTDFGYDIIVTAANGQRIAQITEKGSFTMPACKVSVTAVRNETFALMSTAWNQSYVYSYDADMNKIKVNSTKKRGVIVINLGEEYSGKSFTIYSGRKSTKVKVTEGVLDEKGKFVFEVPDGKNYTLVVED